MGISGNAVPSKNGKRRKVIYRRNIFSLNTQTVRFRVTNIKEKKVFLFLFFLEVFILNTYMSE